ncbi:alpha/beta fold hydrolase [Egicoccus sp. AB-alg6-2]|uniref:alpha/beta fold hydrolase n=1 Tax=Egicoccus sp. AB-alg6-2 TaxID=3242692 RepID=UPI00359D02EF
MPRRAGRAALAALLLIASALVPAEGAAAEPVHYRPPVDLEVVRGFAAPVHEFGAGHRGVDLAAAPGDVVVSAGDGVVAHAGDVAGTTWVTVAHPDGVTTSYGPLTAIAVRSGQEVTGGQRLGVVAAGGHGPAGDDHGLHWGARRGGVYVDPLTLLGPAKLPSLVGPGGWEFRDFDVTPYEPWAGSRFGGLEPRGSPVADRPGFAVPPNANHLVSVGGLNSATGTRLIDPDHLGYGDDSATRFSYAGLDERGRPKPYGPADTWGGVDLAARRLAEHLRAQQRRQPHRPVDLVGHSQGGVVILHYLANYHDPHDPTLPGIGSVVTIASPHRGSDLASLGRAAREHTVLGTALAGGLHLADRQGRRVAGMVGTPLDELRVGSDLLGGLAQDWQATVDAGVAGPLSTGTRVLTVGGTVDPVVGAHRARSPSDGEAEVVQPHRVLPGHHSGVLDTQAVREVTYRFLAGDEVPESPGHLPILNGWATGTLLQVAGHGLQLHDAVGLARRVLGNRATPPTVPGR